MELSTRGHTLGTPGGGFPSWETTLSASDSTEHILRKKTPHQQEADGDVRKKRRGTKSLNILEQIIDQCPHGRANVSVIIHFPAVDILVDPLSAFLSIFAV